MKIRLTTYPVQQDLAALGQSAGLSEMAAKHFADLCWLEVELHVDGENGAICSGNVVGGKQGGMYLSDLAPGSPPNASAGPSKSPEAKRVDGYLGTISRIEPEVHMIDAGAFYASAAISLKRIADAAVEVLELAKRSAP